MRIRLSGWLVALLWLLGSVPTYAQPTIDLPTLFVDEFVTALSAPTALDWTPDGRLLLTTQGGTLRVYQNGSTLPTPALSFSSSVLCSNSERGLLGITVDPNFASNGSIYLYYTFNNPANGCRNRVSRFTLSSNNTVAFASELVLIDNIHSPAGNHNGGDLAFGKDGLLYVSVGDGGCDYMGDSGCAGSNDAARDKHVLLGKILRITADGAIPASNPFQGAGTGRCNTTGSTASGNHCQETFAWGLRNPFRFAFDPNATGVRFFINDVGQNVSEEINEGQAGADYGWNVREGLCARASETNCGPPPAGMTNPIHAYFHSTTNCYSITGGAFVPQGLWGSDYNNAYLFSDYVCGKIFMIKPDRGGYVRTEFATNLGGSSAVALKFGPPSNPVGLYYTTYAGGGQVRRIRYTGAVNRAPNAVISATPTAGFVPLQVRFDGSASSDPDAGTTLRYIWNFGDGSPTITTTSALITHTYTLTGTYSASLRVRDQLDLLSSAATIDIFAGNQPPAPQIEAPTSTTLFAVGETLTLVGSAFDSEDGPLADARLTWTALIHHNTHTHSYLGPIVGNHIQLVAPAPEDLQAVMTSYVEIRLAATDAQGQTTIITQALRPQIVPLTFNTAPGGLRLTINDDLFSDGSVVNSWENYQLRVNAPIQPIGGQWHGFPQWSDGGAPAHVLITPDAPTSYNVIFEPVEVVLVPNLIRNQ